MSSDYCSSFPSCPLDRRCDVCPLCSGCSRRAVMLDADGKRWCGTGHEIVEIVHRNDRCSCGSGRKFKRCCGVAASKRPARSCRVCGCTRERACVEQRGGESVGCRWVAADLCSSCSGGRTVKPLPARISS